MPKVLEYQMLLVKVAKFVKYCWHGLLIYINSMWCSCFPKYWRISPTSQHETLFAVSKIQNFYNKNRLFFPTARSTVWGQNSREDWPKDELYRV
jgi:hypothetical protein